MKKPVTKKKTTERNKIEKERISPEIEKASKIAGHYGFSLLPKTEVEKEDIQYAKKFRESHLKTLHPFREKADRFSGFLEEKISLIRHFQNKVYAEMPQPVTAFYEGPLHGNPHIKEHSEEESFNLEIIGSSKSISDATIIETAYIILKDRYPDKNFSVEINSIGDKDASAKFVKELTLFVKKEISKLNKPCKEAVKKDIFNLFSCDHSACLEVQERAPKSITYLNESGRNHFKEVLEYLESLGIPYAINHTLIGSRSYCTDTIFEIIGTKKDGTRSIYAIGERYNHLAKKIWNKREIPALGVSIALQPHFVIGKKKIGKEKVVKSKFYFIQFGFDAKLKSLALIEMLRQAGISVEQSLSKDKLSVQLAYAEKANIPYIIIMGQKEALENSVVVRNLETRCQETLSTKELVSYLKKLK